MTDRKLTDDELQRCIECCIKGKVWGDCKKLNCPAIRKQGCHFYLRTDDDYENTIYIEILKDALALINRQKVEIESLKIANEKMYSANKEQEAEIERLNAVHADMTESLRLAAEANKDMQAELKSLKHRYDLAVAEREANVKGFAETLKTIKAEAIKEFAERLQKRAGMPLGTLYGKMVYLKDIDTLVKEMTEELK